LRAWQALSFHVLKALQVLSLAERVGKGLRVLLLNLKIELLSSNLQAGTLNGHVARSIFSVGSDQGFKLGRRLLTCVTWCKAEIMQRTFSNGYQILEEIVQRTFKIATKPWSLQCARNLGLQVG
jgi:hypothetical protein